MSGVWSVRFGKANCLLMFCSALYMCVDMATANNQKICTRLDELQNCNLEGQLIDLSKNADWPAASKLKLSQQVRENWKSSSSISSLQMAFVVLEAPCSHFCSRMRSPPSEKGPKLVQIPCGPLVDPTPTITALRIGISLPLASHALEVVRAPSLGSFGRPSRQIPKHLERSSHLLQRPPSNGNHALRRNVEHLHRKSASHPPNPACCQSSPW